MSRDNIKYWIFSENKLWRKAVELIHSCRNKDVAAEAMVKWLRQNKIKETPDGVPYIKTAIRHVLGLM